MRLPGLFSWWEENAKKSWVKNKFAEMTSAIQNEVREKFSSLSKQVLDLRTGQARRMSDAKGIKRFILDSL